MWRIPLVLSLLSARGRGGELARGLTLRARNAGQKAGGKAEALAPHVPYNSLVEQFALEFDLAPQRRVYTVSELNAAIRAALDERVPGHLGGGRDLRAEAGRQRALLLHPEGARRAGEAAWPSARRTATGSSSRATGWRCWRAAASTSTRPRGEYQLLVETLEPQGVGALQLAFEQLKKKLAAEGLFARRAKAAAAALPAAHRHRDLAARRGHRGHDPDPRAPLSRAAHPPLPGAGAGRGIGGGSVPRHRVLQPARAGPTW